jgi:hypothetical protein
MTQTYLAKDRFQHPIQALEPATVQNVTFTTGSSAATAADLSGNTVVVRLVATADCYVSIGPGGSVDATSGSMYLSAFAVEYFRVDQGVAWRVAALGVASGGALNVTQMT